MKITEKQLADAFGRREMGVQYFPLYLGAPNRRPYTEGSIALEKIVEAVNSIPMIAMTPEPETCETVGVKADGTEVALGPIPVPPTMKAREIVRSYFGGDPDDDMSEASMALGAMEELINWLKEQGRLK